MGSDGVIRTISLSKGSLYINLPSQFAQQLELRKGDQIKLTLLGSQITMQKVESD